MSDFVNCPECNSDDVVVEPEIENFIYGDGPKTKDGYSPMPCAAGGNHHKPVEMAVTVPVFGCKSCGRKWTNYLADDIKDYMVKKIHESGWELET